MSHPPALSSRDKRGDALYMNSLLSLASARAIRRLHPHQRIHLHPKGFLNAEGHVSGEITLYHRLTLTARVVLEALLERYTQHDRDFERSLQRRRILVLFDRNDRLPCDARLDRRVPAASSPAGPGVLESDCVLRASERSPVSHNLRGGLGDIRDDQHAKEDAQKMKPDHPVVQLKMADGRVKPQHAQPDHHQ